MLKNSNETIALPSFELVMVAADTQEATSVQLDELLKQSNQGLILYFYPKDNTQGCSIQAIDFSEHKAKLESLGFCILGVSRDGVKSHQNFINKKALSIDLISDTDEKLCQHYDVIKEKMMYGKTHLGVVRSTFVYNKNGEMIGSFRNVKAKEHVDKILDFIENQAH
ncbi:peroxiredoxin [Moraxella canis]|uniref:thioredoxin-dependent peroxiredoxin n=1 Tax=Moraxella canis TaxID=90239 RepID=A0A1S9ZJF9_9GAMM|nr:peroxiredoxin [Moraxella canis]OOR83417.1 peroxiredoxin [Moraxella canis]